MPQVGTPIRQYLMCNLFVPAKKHLTLKKLYNKTYKSVITVTFFQHFNKFLFTTFLGGLNRIIATINLHPIYEIYHIKGRVFNYFGCSALNPGYK